MHAFTLSPHASSWLNFMRWFSALLVVAGHLRSIMFVTWQGVIDKSFLNECLYLFTRFGHEAVVVFFVISGILVGYTTLQRIQEGSFRFGNYLITRFARIYIVLVPALIIGAVLDFLGIHYFNAEDFYQTGNSYSSAFNYSIVERLSLKNFLGNLLMLQNHKGFITYGSNSPLWSLAYEWFYYLLFPCLILVIESKIKIQKWIYAFFGISLLWFMPVDMRLYFIIWLVGVGVPYIRVSLLNKIPLAVFGLITGLTFLIKEIVYLQNHVFIIDLITSLSLSLFLAKILTGKEKSPLKFSLIHDELAGFSYSVYVMHMPLIVFFTNLLTLTDVRMLHLQPDVFSLMLFVLLLTMTFGLCYIFSLFTEKNTDKLKQTLLKRTPSTVKGLVRSRSC